MNVRNYKEQSTLGTAYCLEATIEGETVTARVMWTALDQSLNLAQSQEYIEYALWRNLMGAIETRLRKIADA